MKDPELKEGDKFYYIIPEKIHPIYEKVICPICDGECQVTIKGLEFNCPNCFDRDDDESKGHIYIKTREDKEEIKRLGPYEVINKLNLPNHWKYECRMQNPITYSWIILNENEMNKIELIQEKESNTYGN